MAKLMMLILPTMLAMMSLAARAAEGDDEDSIKVEIRGTLRTGIVAIGGETTGTVIKVKDVTWELDLGGNQGLQELAKTLDTKKALVTGTYAKFKGVERERDIVKVASLKAAAAR
jgi:hypothetical protein